MRIKNCTSFAHDPMVLGMITGLWLAQQLIYDSKFAGIGIYVLEVLGNIITVLHFEAQGVSEFCDRHSLLKALKLKHKTTINGYFRLFVL